MPRDDDEAAHLLSIFRRAHQRELADCGALRVLVQSLPRRAAGLSHEARVLLSERMRDCADLVERGLTFED